MFRRRKPNSKTARRGHRRVLGIEGENPGRRHDAAGNGAPKPLSKNVKVTPANITGDNTFGTVTLQSEGAAEPGTHMVFLQATAKVGNDTVVQYSPVFPLTIADKAQSN